MENKVCSVISATFKTFEEIMKRINYTTVGRLNHKLHQIIRKRWEMTRTKYAKLRQYGIYYEDVMKIANSRKGYWHLSKNTFLHRTLPNKKLAK